MPTMIFIKSQFEKYKVSLTGSQQASSLTSPNNLWIQ